MAQFSTHQTKIEPVITFTIDEAEARALDALVGYGTKSFLDVFKKNLGAHYMEGNEKGLEKFFESIRQQIPNILTRINEARAAFNPKPPKRPEFPKGKLINELTGEETEGDL